MRGARSAHKVVPSLETTWFAQVQPDPLPGFTEQEYEITQ